MIGGPAKYRSLGKPVFLPEVESSAIKQDYSWPLLGFEFSASFAITSTILGIPLAFSVQVSEQGDRLLVGLGGAKGFKVVVN